MGLGGIVADGLDGRVRVDVFVCMKVGRWWRGILYKVNSNSPFRLNMDVMEQPFYIVQVGINN